MILSELLSVMMNNTSRSVAESDTGDLGVNTQLMKKRGRGRPCRISGTSS